MPAKLARRQFLALSLVGALVPRVGMAGPTVDGRLSRPYEAEVAILFNLLTFRVKGRLEEEIDRQAGRYQVTMTGEGTGVSSRTEGAGIIQEGRFKPTAVHSTHTVRGRENRTSLVYDYDRRTIEYHSISHTLLLGRRRQADDLLRLAPGQHVDDLFSAELNFAANVLEVDRDGAYQITVVRRARPANEGPDDVSAGGYRAELATMRFRAEPDASTGRLTARVDLTGFSSWARSSQPAVVAFGRDRHLQQVESSMILGTTFTLRCAPVA